MKCIIAHQIEQKEDGSVLIVVDAYDVIGRMLYANEYGRSPVYSAYEMEEQMKKFFAKNFGDEYHFAEFFIENAYRPIPMKIFYRAFPKTEDQKYRECLNFLLEGLPK